MEWKLNGGDRTLNFDNIQNLYVREKNGHIDKIADTSWPTLMKIKHFFVEIFTDYKYFEGNDALAEIRKNSKEVEANCNIDFSNPEKNLNPFGKHISLKIHQVSSPPTKRHVSEPINEFDEQNLNDRDNSIKPKSMEQTLPSKVEELPDDYKLSEAEKNGPKGVILPFEKNAPHGDEKITSQQKPLYKTSPQVEELPDDYELNEAKKMSSPAPKEEAIELPEQGLNKFPSENNPEFKASAQNAPEAIVEREPKIQPTVINQGFKQEEPPNRLESAKVFIDEFKTHTYDPLANPHPISALIKNHQLNVKNNDDYNVLKEIVVYLDQKEPHEIEKDNLSEIPDEIKFNLYESLFAERVERSAVDKSLGVPEFRNHLSEEWRNDLDRKGLEHALKIDNLKPEDIKFYMEKLGLQKDDRLLKQMMLNNGYVLTLVSYLDGRTTKFSNEYLKSTDENGYVTGDLKFDPSAPSIFA